MGVMLPLLLQLPMCSWGHKGRSMVGQDAITHKCIDWFDVRATKHLHNMIPEQCGMVQLTLKGLLQPCQGGQGLRSTAEEMGQRSMHAAAVRCL
jgi:hypothetical protein